MAPKYSAEAIQVRKELVNSPEFDALPVEKKRAALNAWADKYQTGRPVTISDAPLSVSPGEARTLSPGIIKAAQPQYRPASQPMNQRTVKPELGSVANTVGVGLDRSMLGSVARIGGQPLLPTGGLREPKGLAEQLGATAVQSITDLAALGPTNAAIGPVMGGAVMSGLPSALRGNDLRTVALDAAAGAVGGQVAKSMPGSELAPMINRNLVQSAAQLPFQVARDGQMPSGDDLLANALFGVAMDAAIPSNRISAKTFANDAAPLPSMRPRTSERGSWSNAPVDPLQTGSNPPPPDPEPNQPAPGAFEQRKVTDAERRVFGDDVKNVRGEAAKVTQAVGWMMDPGEPRNTASPEQIAKVQPDKYFNFNKVNLSQDEANNLRGLVQEAVAETGGDPKKRIPFAQIQDEAAQVDPQLLAYLKPPKEGETLHPAVRLAARERLNALNQQSFNLRKEIEAKAATLTAEDRGKLEAVADRLENDAKGLIDVLYPTRSQDGRNLAYHKIVARNGFDAEYWVSRARRIAFGALPDDQHKEIMAIVARGNEAQDAGDQTAIDEARRDLALTLSRLEKTPVEQRLTGLWKAGLLTGIKTHLRNVTGNGAYQVMEEVARLPASLVDTGLGIMTGRRTVGAGSVVELGKAAVVGGRKGFAEAKQIMRNGATNESLQRLELVRDMNSGYKVIDAYVNGVFRSLSAEDAVFRNIAIQRSLQEQARMLALTEAKQGTIQRADVKARADELLNNPTADMQTNAVTAAELATFTNDNPIADAVTAGRRALRQKYGKAGERMNATIDYFLPFVKTPTNVLARTIEYMGGHALARGIGQVRNVASGTMAGITGKDIVAAKREWARAITAEDQQRLSMAVGRAGVGWGMMLLGHMLAEKGLMTGISSKEDKGKRGMNTIAGMPDGAIKIGDRWFQISGIVPGGALMAVGATWQNEGVRDLADEGRRTANQAAIVSRMVSEQPMLQGVSNVKEMLDSPGALGERAMTQLGRSMVPSIVGDVAQAVDGTQRRPDGYMEGIQSRLPFVSQGVEPKLTPLGDPAPVQPLAFIDLFNSKPETDNPVVQDMVRLGVSLAAPPQTFTWNEKGKKKSDRLDVAEHNQLITMTGKAIKDQLLMKYESKEYAKADDDHKQQMLEDAITNGRRLGAKQFKREVLDLR